MCRNFIPKYKAKNLLLLGTIILFLASFFFIFTFQTKYKKFLFKHNLMPLIGLYSLGERIPCMARSSKEKMLEDNAENP
ncbi:hypothetical protein DT065_10640 [Salicibibacter kimchii]|uniref:Uncharacterized protein n=1 Tax=Salicibibacter kimchii TaxID=2099786 RepID=A0A345BZQ3_9BACI|nr:hypothetical protein DT065_10640 [Salicibibacter kimchii]